jgi:uncharacterized protein YwgA
MASIKDVVAYIINSYPYKAELSNARITKMIYLADWHHAIKYRSQVTHIKWYFDNYGPYVSDVITDVTKNPDLFNVEKIKNLYGTPKNLISLKDESYIPSLKQSQMKSLDFIIEITKSLNWTEFVSLVYSTYPITSSEKYYHLDLVEKATAYSKLK